jgi:polyhydroxyalkanoate synthesis repressor PhaR
MTISLTVCFANLMAEATPTLQCGKGRMLHCPYFLHLQLCGAESRFLPRSISSGEFSVSEDQGKNDHGKADQNTAKNATVIKKYANRRLYNTATSTYVTLEDLSKMVKDGSEFVVYDAKTGEDITRSVLTQIIFEEENKDGNNLLPINFLRQLIRFYGDSMQGMVPNYLEFSMGNLMKDQDKLKQQMQDTFAGGDALKMVEETAKRNMQLFQDSMKMFTPFGAPNFANPFAPTAEPAPAKPAPAASKDDLQVLKDQLAAMQQKIEAMNR